MTDSGVPIQSQTATFLAGGAKRGEGHLLLYPGNLPAVISKVETWAYLVWALIAAAIAVPLLHRIWWLGIAVGSVIGGQAGEAVNRRRAIRKGSAGGDGVTVIPLDLITSAQTRKPAGWAGRWGVRILVVTTADGTEYGFRGQMGNWQAYLTSALAMRGRAVRRTAEGITIRPWTG